MLIEKLILHKYTRLFLNNITTLTFTPETVVQLILGSNGSGKSSLMEMLDPLPADIKNKFNEGGYKEIHIRKDKKLYIITSGKLSAGKHTFEVDGIELNVHGTKTVQLQLVKQHFNITPKSNEIVLGKTVLTGMSTTDRKHWFREMSLIDYTYSIDTYNKLKGRLRDIVGGIKIITNELVKDADLKLTPEDIEKYKKSISETKELIEDFMYSYDNSSENYIDISSELKQNVSKLEKLYDSKIHDVPTSQYQENLSMTKSALVNIDKDIDTVTAKLRDIQYIEDNSCDIKQIKENIAYAEKESGKLINICDKYDISHNSASVVENDFNAVYGRLIDIASSFAEYDHVKIKRDSFKALEDNVNVNLQELNELGTKHKTCEMKKSTLLSAVNESNKIICGNCNHESYFGYDEKLLKNVISDMDDIKTKIDKIKPMYLRDVKELDLVKSKIALIESLREVFHSRMSLLPLWNKMIKDKTIGEINSIEMQTYLNTVKSEITNIKVLPRFKITLEEEYKKLEIGKEIIEVRKKTNIKSKDECIESIEKMYVTRTKLIKDIEFYTRVISESVTISNCLTELQNCLNQNKKNKKIEIKNVKNEYIKTVVANLKMNLINYEDKINTNEKVLNRIKTNENILKEYREREEVLNKVLKALSPTEGLIAKSINGFINKILTEMNSFINNVWSYNITLLPCSITDENDLDYKFKVKVAGKKTIKDVSELSTSMKDIVNLAFRVIFMKYSRLNHLPIFLDEFGTTMDDAHRHSAYVVIETILCNAHSQVFICAHFKSIYGRFMKADINILDSKNLDIDTDIKYNTNLIIE